MANRHWFIYPLIDTFIAYSDYVSIIERLKKWVTSCVENEEDKKSMTRLTVDIYIVLKWLIVLCWLFFVHSYFLLLCVWYLLLTNFLTYFKYHFRQQKDPSDNHITKRWFIAIIQAFFFSNLCFSYIYLYYSGQEYKFSASNDALSAWLFSNANSLTADYWLVEVLSNFWYSVSILQVCMTLIFLSVLLAKSMPSCLSSFPKDVI